MQEKVVQLDQKEEKFVYTSGSHNCGGRCLLKVQVRDGRVVGITNEDDQQDTPSYFQLRGCLRCRAYRDRLYHPDRLLYPLKRIGKRGEGKFEQITWSEALDYIADKTKQVMQTYGPEAIYLNYGTGNAGQVSERTWLKRLLSLYGGYLSYYGTYSSACTSIATPYTYGTNQTGNSREDWVNSKLLILLGWNPADTVWGTNTSYYLKKAKEAGAKIIVIDPIYSNTAVSLADQWIAIKPTTDSALLAAMAYVSITEKLYDMAFLNQFCLGFDEQHMPEGILPGNSYKSYILGLSADQTEKTPLWAESITGISETVIIELARAYGTTKPAALIEGYGPQRHAYGEQIARSGPVLAAMTGNIGIAGGWASGKGNEARNHFVAAIPYENPCKAKISVFSWPDAVLHGQGMGGDFSVQGVDCLSTNIKLIFNVAGNCLVNQHSDANQTAALLQDESLVECIVVNDQFMTASAKFADIILPADNMMERNDIVQSWAYGDYVLYMNQAVDTVGQCRNGYDWVSDLAERLNLKDEFTEGKSLDAWLQYLVAETAKQNPGFPAYETFKGQGIYRWQHDRPAIAFEKQIANPSKYSFPTPSGKIELFSARLWDMKKPAKIPAIPQYIPAWEGPADPLIEKYPLQCIGAHSKRRAHSTFDNVKWLEEVERQEVWINSIDAAARDIRQNDRVQVYNERGTIELPAKVTARIMPGVVSVPQGAWWMPDSQGIDQRGSINTLTKYQPTPLAFGNPQHTNLVEIKKV